ncbi:MAG: helix-turn-helix domain-containing protein [Dehalococcoidia bacterium]
MPDGLPSDFAERIRLLRARLGLTQSRLAELLGASTVSVNRWEHSHARPSASARRKLLRAEAGGIAALAEGLGSRVSGLGSRSEKPGVFLPGSAGRRLSRRSSSKPACPTQVTLRGSEPWFLQPPRPADELHWAAAGTGGVAAPADHYPSPDDHRRWRRRQDAAGNRTRDADGGTRGAGQVGMPKSLPYAWDSASTGLPS